MNIPTANAAPGSRRSIAAAILSAVLVAMLCGLLASPSVSARPGAADRPSPVTLARVTRSEMREEVSLFGTSVPWRRVQLSPLVAGLATEVLVDTGDWVKPDQPLLTLDTKLADIEIRTAEARVAAAAARRSDALRKRDELKRLKADRHASKTAIESAEAELAIANAELSRERSELALAQELRNRHQVRAPFAGMIIDKLVETGQWVQRDDAVFELVELDTLRIRATLPQRLYPRIRAGADARVRFDALPERDFAGRVFARIAAGDASSRSFPLLIDIDNSAHLLAPGMSARVWVELDQDRVSVLTVPRDSVVAKSSGERLVWRVDDSTDGLQTFPVQVEVGRAVGERLEVVSDELSDGDRVVLLGNERLRPGQAVVDRTGSAPLASQ